MGRTVRDEPIAPDDLQRVNRFAAVAKRFVACAVSKEVLLDAWRALPSDLQRRAIAIAHDLGIGAYFEGLVGALALHG